MRIKNGNASPQMTIMAEKKNQFTNELQTFGEPNNNDALQQLYF
ncbi:7145_t:CDS:2 [Diversispora eburnea]|uniref:7145_t:CDS:1 n=1 Tax=Diversispora eburnea TaxID=1213867 RepID=A0A9N8V5Q2_9GLOM|nr:7145_t:CDS:2 [Diversispora eburnea]